MKNVEGIRVAVYITGGWYDLAPVATEEEFLEWERVAPLLDWHAGIASGTYKWTGRWAH